MYFAVVLTSVMIVSCKSDADQLKDIAENIDEIAAKMEKVDNEKDFQNLANEYNKVMDSAPSSLKEMSEEELSKIDGAEKFVEAVARFNVAYSNAVSEGFAGALSDMSNRINEAYEKATQELDDNESYEEDSEEDSDQDSEEETEETSSEEDY